MRISKIVRVGKEDKFAIFIDDKMELILSAEVILEAGLQTNQEINEARLQEIKNLQNNQKFMNLALRYVSKRLKTESETKNYLKRKGASLSLTSAILKRLKELDLINDAHYVTSYIHDHTLISPYSKRKIIYELKKKQIATDIIDKSLKNDQIIDIKSLQTIIEQKRRIPKFKDDLKLMQYLVRIGFNYQDVKEALKVSNNLD